MKKILLFTSTVVLFGTLFVSSCSKTDDPTATPASSDPREKFLGNWYYHENSVDNGVSTHYVDIADSSNTSYIMFAYLYGYNKKTYATFNGNNFTFPAQTIQGQVVTGSGVLSNSNTINMTYLVKTTGTHFDTVRANLTK